MWSDVEHKRLHRYGGTNAMENILTKVLPQEGGLEGSRSGIYNGVIGLLGIITVIGVAFGVHAMFIGHEHA